MQHRLHIQHRYRRRSGPPTVAAALAIGALLIGCTPGTAPIPSTGSETSSTVTSSTSGRPWPPGEFTAFRVTPPDSATGRRIGLISPDAGDPFSRTVTESIITQAGIAGAELIRCDPGLQGEYALDCAQRMRTQQVDAWVVQRGSWDFTGALCTAGPQNVPLIVVNGSPGPCTTATVSSDDVSAGRVAGTSLGRYADHQFDCDFDALLVLGDPSAPAVSATRIQGIRDGFRSVCADALTEPLLTTTATTTAPSTPVPSTPVSSTPAPSTSESGSTAGGSAPVPSVTVLDTDDAKSIYDTVQRVIDGHPHSHRLLVAAVADGPAFTAMTAIRASGRVDDVVLAAIGADQRSRCEIATNGRWLGDAALFPDRYGQLVVPYLIDAMNGKTIPQAMITEPLFLGAASVGQFYDVSRCAAEATTTPTSTVQTSATAGMTSGMTTGRTSGR